MNNKIAGPLLAGFLASAPVFADAPIDAKPAPALLGEGPKADAPPPYYGLTFDLSVADASGLSFIGNSWLNELNYYFEPKWMVGQRFLTNTKFKNLEVDGRFLLTQGLHGFDEATFGSQANAGPETPCSSPNPSSNGGVIDPTQVGYCNPQANNRRLDYSDLWVTFKNPQFYTIPRVAVDVNPSLRFIMPTSAESQFHSLVMSLAPGVSLSRQFLNDKLKVLAGVSLLKNFNRYKTPANSADVTGSLSEQGGNPYSGVSSELVDNGLANFYADPGRLTSVGGINVDYTWRSSVDVSYDFTDKFNLDVLYVYIDNHLYPQDCNQNVGAGVGMVDLCQNGDAVAAASLTTVNRPGNHDEEVFWVTATYNVNDWLGAYLSWVNWAPAQYPDSSLRGLFGPGRGGNCGANGVLISTCYDAFTQVSLGATVHLEKLAQAKVPFF